MSQPDPSFRRGPIVPARIRRVAGQSFAFVPHRFLREGFFCSLSTNELRLYVFLVLAADRDGMSFYHQDRICSTLEVDLDDYLEARNGLLAKDLIAFDGKRFQVLSLPAKPVWPSSQSLRTRQQLESDDPATVRQLIRDSLSAAKRGPDE
jgi:hypothetical protein